MVMKTKFVIEPSGSPKAPVQRLFAVISRNEQGLEGIVAIGSSPDKLMPCIVSDRELAQQLLNHVTDGAIETKTRDKILLAEFERVKS